MTMKLSSQPSKILIWLNDEAFSRFAFVLVTHFSPRAINLKISPLKIFSADAYA